MNSSQSRHQDPHGADRDLMLPLQELQQAVDREKLKELVIKCQDEVEKGYYCFRTWAALHGELFGVELEPVPHPVLNMWRVLKLVNFGDDYVPTGLIYDTLMTLMMMAAHLSTESDKARVIEEVESLLKSIFFKFIEFNGKYLSEDEKDELAFFRVLRPVAEGYRKIIFTHLEKDEPNQKKEKLSRNEQLYKMHDVFLYKKNLQKLKKIEEQFKQCTFEPDLSYTLRSQSVEAKYLQPSRSRKAHNFASSHLINDPDYIIHQQQHEEEKTFKANPVPSYPEVSPQGMDSHLERMQRSREIRKINELRAYSSSSLAASKGVKEFGIEQRDRERKERMINSYRILFNVKVEVGKRIYRVKVRQNMGISDVVKAIELMVGFKHPEIEQIVKGYFINWEIKTSKQAYPRIQQFSYEDQSM